MNTFVQYFMKYNGFEILILWACSPLAMTFVNEDESVGVVVTAFVNGYIKDGEDNQTIYGYDLNQSEEQKKVKSLEEIMGGKNKVEMDHCSFFIDMSHVQRVRRTLSTHSYDHQRT